MGWLSQATKGPLESPDGAFEAPDRNSRTRCWEARDNYFKCLDRFDILDGIRNHDMATKHCGTESKDLERNCASSWIEYFKKRRVAERKKEETLKQLEGRSAK